MNERYGIVYLGSKEKILHLVKYIFEREYKKEYMIDLFCGGLSVSAYGVKRSKFNVLANDLNKYTIALYKAVVENKTDDRIYKWVSKYGFDYIQDHPEEFDPWYVGFVINMWSFGCDQKSYLYARDIEDRKHALFNAIVDDDFSLIEADDIFSGLYIPEKIRNIEYRKHPEKRVLFMNYFHNFIENLFDEERKEKLRKLNQIVSLSLMEHLEDIKKIDFNKIEFTSLDWESCYNSIPKETLEKSFIYCDPPYEGKKKYMAGRSFDYDRFWNWFRNCPYPVYVSSYDAPEDIKPINFDFKIQLLDNGDRKREEKKPKKTVQENIYWNGKGDAEPTMYDLLFNEEKST